MVVLNIDGKDYTLEYTIEASLHKNCVEKVYNFVMNATGGSGKDAISDAISAMSDIPRTALTVFYAGLLEHHGEDGDNTVPTKKEAKQLIKQYFEDKKDTDEADFYAIMALMIEVMEEDGFFKRTGLEKILTAGTEKLPKKPQDHKKPTKVIQK